MAACMVKIMYGKLKKMSGEKRDGERLSAESNVRHIVEWWGGGGGPVRMARVTSEYKITMRLGIF